jgi:peptidoglycan/xylan/chitin deacetylase (PgdA/CDA1 family)
MSWSVLRDLPPAISLGAHTITHPDLRSLADLELVRELRESRLEIEHRTGRAVDTFAFPYGTADTRATAVARREFAMACGTRLDFAGIAADRAALPRLDTYYLQSPQWFSRLFGIPAALYIDLRRRLREARTAGIPKAWEFRRPFGSS